MTSLHALKVEIGVDTLCFDGSLCIDGREMRVQGIDFSTLAIHGYGSTHIPSVAPNICIQSDMASNHNVWYRLTCPSAEYFRYHEAFLWIADLAKYSLDFMLSRETVGLAQFRRDFGEWLEESFGRSKCVRDWLSQYGSKEDFRSAIAANIHYLWKEAYDIDEKTDRHPLWAETDQNRLNAIPQHKRSEDSTIVTPFIHNLFNKMSFNGFLKVQDRSLSLRSTTAHRRKLLKLIPASTMCVDWTAPTPQAAKSVKPEDVVYVRPDQRSEWSTTEETWLALVQKVRTLKSGRTKLDLLWLYRPSDTSIGQSFYPFQNELFLSDNCSCGGDAYDLQDVLGRADVLWGNHDLATAAQEQAYVVRQTYMTDSHEFATFRQEHLSCRCKDYSPHPFAEAVADYPLGSFILYRTGNLESDTGRDIDSILEPGQVMSFLYTSHRLRLRVLRRARTKQPTAPPNELLWTEEYIETPAYNHVRLCEVQGFSNVDDVAEVFRRGGAGDLFYYIYHAEDPNPFPRQMSPSLRPLRGLGICCGGGSFDRGLEDGQAVRFEHAIDFDSLALHTYRANADPNHPPNLFLGPMEKYLEDSLQAGPTTYPRANIGDIELIAAGSPCQSFSILQPDKESSRSLKHASLIACVLSFVEHYMPYYFYLENVVAISSVAKGVSEDQSMMRKIIATLVALGYQLQQHILDAPSYGSFQSRRRVIVTATAPGLTPPARPPQSHLSRPDTEQFRVTSLGSLANGKRFGASQDELAPFETVTFHEGTKDLPDIGDGHTYTCIPFPDHRQGGARLSHEQRRLIPLIPQYPRGMGLAKAHELGKIPEPQAQRWLSNKTRSATNSKSFSRVQPDTIITTITTGLHTIDAFVGTCIHPNQNRLLTVMEARRAQGFPDHEVILGGREQQWKIIGNSVHRNVAFALGLSLKDA
ncbi:S-adenosyl-L-methionine-dependent methyltransferase, partial [Elsinoe ampelina]